MMDFSRRALLGTALAAPALAPALAQGAWPNRPVRFIVPFAPGGPVEVPARVVAELLTRTMGQPFIVETRPGAGGALGVQAVVQAHDPHVLLFTTSSVAIVPALMRDPGYDPLKDLTPISLVTDAPITLLARPGGRVKDLAGLIDLAKQKPGEVSYASSGVGSTTHLAGALLAQMAGIDLLHVPYRGAGQAVNAVYSGDTDLLVTGTIEAIPHVRDGRLVGIAITGPRRIAPLPEVPTVGEVVPGYALTIWYGMFGPAGMDPAIASRIVADCAPLLRGGMLKERMDASGADLLLDGPGPLAERLAREVPQWKAVTAAAGIRAE